MTTPEPDLAAVQYCYLTTTGRVSGRPHEIEIWFALVDSTVYLLAGDPQSDWVRNLGRNPRVSVRIAGSTFQARARTLVAGDPADRLARRLLFDKYNPTYSSDLTSWRDSALPVAIDLDIDPARAIDTP